MRVLAVLFLGFQMLTAGQAVSQSSGSSASPEGLAQQVGKRLLSLPDYAVFDSLSFELRGSTVVLKGYASRPALKDDAAKAAKSVAGVQAVENDIQVLPYSPNDDRLRVAVFRRIYGAPTLRKYSNGAPLVVDPLAVAAGGITNDPPLGFHAIHIVVDNGRVTLTGVVDSKQDAEMAYIQANGTPGTFAVTNQLNFPGKTPE